jgi:hypothetical protein
MKTKTLLRRALGVLGALAIMLSWSTLAADTAATNKPAPDRPADARTDVIVTKETAKDAVIGDASKQIESPLTKAMTKGATTTGGVDPHGDSLLSIQNSFQQFAHPTFMLRLFLSLTLAVGCAWVIAWRPRSLQHLNPMCDLEERKAFIILGVVGAIVAELSGTNPTLAFVIFGIGALLRFRTVLDNPKATGKAILVVVIGLACGMGSWTMAVFVTVFSWALLYWLDSHLTGNLTIRLDGHKDPKSLQAAVESLLLSYHCRPRSCTLSKGNKRMEFLFQMPAGLNQEKLEADVRAKLPKTGETEVKMEVV